jgi:hypothetical protein
MNANKRLNYFRTGVVLATLLFLGSPFPANSSPLNGGGGKAGGITMMTVAGKVVQTIDSGGYTYVLIERDGAQTWVALPKSRITVGDEISCQPGMIMKNFRSSSLKRTFELIVFSGGLSLTSDTTPSTGESKTQDNAPEPPKPPENWKNF